MNRRIVGASLSGLLILAVTASAGSGKRVRIQYNGQVTHEAADFSGFLPVILRVYDQPTGGKLWCEDSNTVAVVEGHYKTYLGDNMVSGTMRWTKETNTSFYMEVEENGIVLTPREPFANVRYLADGSSGSGAAAGLHALADYSVVEEFVAKDIPEDFPPSMLDGGGSAGAGVPGLYPGGPAPAIPSAPRQLPGDRMKGWSVVPETADYFKP